MKGYRDLVGMWLNLMDLLPDMAEGQAKTAWLRGVLHQKSAL